MIVIEGKILKEKLYIKINLLFFILLFFLFSEGQNKIESDICNFIDSQFIMNKHVVLGENHYDSNTFYHYNMITFLKTDCNIFLEAPFYLNFLKEQYLNLSDTLFLLYFKEKIYKDTYSYQFILTLIKDSSSHAKHILKNIYFIDVNYIKI